MPTYICVHDDSGELMLTGSLDWNTRRILRHLYMPAMSSQTAGHKAGRVFRYGRNELTGHGLPL